VVFGKLCELGVVVDSGGRKFPLLVGDCCRSVFGYLAWLGTSIRVDWNSGLLVVRVAVVDSAAFWNSVEGYNVVLA